MFYWKQKAFSEDTKIHFVKDPIPTHAQTDLHSFSLFSILFDFLLFSHREQINGELKVELDSLFNNGFHPHIGQTFQYDTHIINKAMQSVVQRLKEGR